MDWKIFWTILIVGILLVVLQGVASWYDSYFSQEQIMRVHHIDNATSFLQHGGMWSDVLIISPIVAYVASKYSFDYSSWEAIALFGCVFVFALVMGEMYRHGGVIHPEAHTHDGYTTFAGRIHGLFAIIALWVCVEVYFGWTTPVVSKTDILIISVPLTLFIPLGVKKFGVPFDSAAWWQMRILIPALWILTIWRVWPM